MRIVSLVPSATETLFALGLGEEVIGVTHECDHPPAARELPHVTGNVIDAGLSAAGIDAAVRERTGLGEAIYSLDGNLLHELQPDLIVTQALCAVCAVSYEDVRAVAGEIASHPRVISLDPRTLGEVLGDVRTLSEAADRRDAGVSLVQDAASRIDRVRLGVRDVARRPRVVALEWFDPVFVAGHWTPQLIDYAGGEDVLGLPGEHSTIRSWDEVTAAAPEVVVAMPCGYDADTARREALEHVDQLSSLGAEVVAVDAAAYFSRPGPRLIDGLELLAHILHPDRFPEAPADALPLEVAVR
jgi:iron complex transport system substrate-binding protein